MAEEEDEAGWATSHLPRAGFVPLESGAGSGLFLCLTKLRAGM